MSGNYEVTLTLPADARLPTIHGKWKRVPTGISATYTRDELAWCLWLGDIWGSADPMASPRFGRRGKRA